MRDISLLEFHYRDGVIEPVNHGHRIFAKGCGSVRADWVQLIDKTADIEGDRVGEQTVPV